MLFVSHSVATIAFLWTRGRLPAAKVNQTPQEVRLENVIVLAGN